MESSRRPRNSSRVLLRLTFTSSFQINSVMMMWRSCELTETGQRSFTSHTQRRALIGCSLFLITDICGALYSYTASPSSSMMSFPLWNRDLCWTQPSLQCKHCFRLLWGQLLCNMKQNRVYFRMLEWMFWVPSTDSIYGSTSIASKNRM